MDPTFAAFYRELHARHWWCRAREDMIVETLRGLPIAPGCDVLDVGCGDGLLFDRLSFLGRVQGVETDPNTIAPDSRYRPRIHLGTLETLRTDTRFSLVLLLDVLEHLEDPRRALLQVRRLLAPEAWIVVTVPALRALWTSHDDLNRHFTRYRQAELVDLARSAGLKVERCRYFFRWVCLPKVAVRLKEALLGARPASPRIPIEPFNRAFYWLSRLEEQLLSRVPLPFGTSLLLLARAQPLDGDGTPDPPPPSAS